VGGQPQFRGPIGIAEPYWINYEPEPRKEGESWESYVIRSNNETLEAFEKIYEETDFLKEALEWDHIRNAVENDGINPLDHLWFVLYFNEEQKFPSDEPMSELMTLREAAAFWTLDLLHLIGSEKLPQVACSALEQGLDSPALRQLAGELKPVASESVPLLIRALGELSICQPDRNAARLIVARFYARQILDGSLSPYDGACRIWWGPANDALEKEKEPEQVSSWLKLRHFIAFASEYQDDVENREAWEADILIAARELLEDPEAA